MLKRRYIQILSAVLYNANFAGFVNGTIYKGDLKGVCVPGLNCYSCPGAIASCPLGGLQAALGEVNYKLPLYIIGTLMLFGVLLGRGVCAFLCPFGFIQELLYKIRTPKLGRSRWTYYGSYAKYAVLIVFVLLTPLIFLAGTGVSLPAFCKYICPSGMLFGGIPLVAMNTNLQMLIGPLFWLKTAVLAAVVLASIFIYRFFCRFICPLGAVYSLFNKYALFGIKVDDKKCTNCGDCAFSCKLDVRIINDRECIRCGDCRSACKYDAIYFRRKSGGEQCRIKKES